MIWLQGTNALRGHEGQPLVIKDVGGKPMLFMVSGCPSPSNCNVVQALDLTDPDHPKVAWNYVKKADRDQSAVPRACCDTVNRGGSYADGKFVYGTLDGFLIARAAHASNLSSSASEYIVVFTVATNSANGEMSTPTAWRPRARASTRVVPPPT